MSETILHFGAGEITVVRVVCAHCGVTTEAPLGQFGRIVRDGACPACKKDLLPTDASGRQVILRELEVILQELAQAAGKVEFILPVQGQAV